MSAKVQLWENGFTDGHPISVPSLEDYNELESRVDELEEYTPSSSEVSRLDDKIKRLEGKISELKKAQSSFKEELEKELSGGKWKTVFEKEVGAAMALIEKRLGQMQKELDEKMRKIPQLDNVRTDIETFFAEQTRKMIDAVAASSKPKRGSVK